MRPGHKVATRRGRQRNPTCSSVLTLSRLSTRPYDTENWLVSGSGPLRMICHASSAPSNLQHSGRGGAVQWWCSRPHAAQ